MKLSIPRSIVIAVVALLQGVPVLAATYYVSPSGSASNAGTLAAPWSLSKANTALAAGDVAMLQSGNYGSASIAPANSGSSYSRYISYVGSLGNPASTIVSGVSFGSAASARQFVSVKGVQLNSTVTFYGANDSLAWCASPSGSVTMELGADDCVVANCSFTGAKLWIEGGTNGPNAATVKRDTLSNCSFNLTLNGYGPAIRINAADGMVLHGCRIVATIEGSGDHGTFKIYGSHFGQFVDCLFDFTNNRTSACDECGLGYFRDYTVNNVFLRDTLIHRAGAGPMNEMLLSASGSFPGTTSGNRYDHCVFIQEQAASVAALYWQDSARSDTVQNCSVISNSQPIEMSGLNGHSLVSHNTFVYLGSNGRAGASGNLYAWGGPGTVVDNIFYSPNGTREAYLVAAAALSGGYTGNNNLLFNSAGASSALNWVGKATSPGTGGKACALNGQECSSRYGDPLFVGGKGPFGFDTHLKTGSPAIGAASDWGDIGAVPFDLGGLDSSPPTPVTSLAIAQTDDTRLQLTWLAPGDTGPTGRAAAYEVRVSTTSMTNSSFASASLVANALVPKVAGQTETLAVEGLLPGTTYFCGIKSSDPSGNVSLLSNIATTTTAVTDTIPPGKVNDLSTGP